MELRSKNKDSFIDELIFSARMPAILAEEILTEKSSEDEELVENTTSEEE